MSQLPPLSAPASRTRRTRGLQDVPALPAAVEQILGDDRFVAAAQGLAAEIAALPDVSTLVPVLEGMIDR